MKRVLVALIASLTLAGALAGASDSVSNVAPSAAVWLSEGPSPVPMGSPGNFAYGESDPR